MSWDFKHFKGAAQEAAFDKVCCEQMWLSAMPFLDSLKFDRLISFDHGVLWERVQVKSCYNKNRNDGRKDSTVINLRRHNNVAYKLDDFEYIFTSIGDIHWLLPWDDKLSKKGQISLTVDKYPDYQIFGNGIMLDEDTCK